MDHEETNMGSFCTNTGTMWPVGINLRHVGMGSERTKMGLVGTNTGPGPVEHMSELEGPKRACR